jgi:hypothetical protein
MTLGVAPKQADLFRSTAGFCEQRVTPDSIYAALHRECFNLFPDELFADLFTDVGRRSVPSSAGQCIWYRSIRSTFSRCSEFSTSRRIEAGSPTRRGAIERSASSQTRPHLVKT